jgi:hypothetical protein
MNGIKSEDLKIINIKICTFFLAMTLCSLVEKFDNLGRKFASNSALKMRAQGSSRTLALSVKLHGVHSQHIVIFKTEQLDESGLSQFKISVRTLFIAISKGLLFFFNTINSVPFDQEVNYNN